MVSPEENDDDAIGVRYTALNASVSPISATVLVAPFMVNVVVARLIVVAAFECEIFVSTNTLR